MNKAAHRTSANGLGTRARQIMQQIKGTWKACLACLPLLLGLLFSSGSMAQQDTGGLGYLDRAMADRLLETLAGSAGDVQAGGFQGFLSKVSGLDFLPETIRQSVAGYRAGDSLSAEQQAHVYRLLGLYARQRYAEEAMATLADLVRFPTHIRDGVPQHENPDFLAQAEYLEALAERFGLVFRNVGQRVYEISLPNIPVEANELVALHAHADVVPANPDNWILPDGTKLDPWTVTRRDGRLYGRGTEDDKNGIVAVMYAMRVIQEEQLPLLRTLKLLVDTTEETPGGAMSWYLERNPTPDYNIALDGGYPVIIAEKGYGTVLARFPAREASGEGAELVHFTGGQAGNQIPGVAEATLLTDNAERLAQALEDLGAEYVAAMGGDFSIMATGMNGRVILRVAGESAHSSEPWTGTNPVSRMFGFINEVSQALPFRENHLLDAVHYAAANFGVDETGQSLGIAFHDDFMGPLTAALTFVDVNDVEMQLITNLRVPRGRTIEALENDILQKLAAWQDEHDVEMDLSVEIEEPMYRDPEGAWVNLLLDVASENLGLPREFQSSDGATSIHYLPNGVQFGLAMPDAKYTGHTDNEFKTVEQFELDLQIVTEMVARLGSLPSLQ